MMEMFDALIIKKPQLGEVDYARKMESWHDHQKKKESESKAKEEKAERLKREIDFIKAKIILFKEIKERSEPKKLLS